MLYRLFKWLLCLSVALNTSANAQGLDNQTRQEMQRDITRLLLERDAGEVANQLALEPPAQSVLPLLRRLNLFARAGHRARALDALNQLAAASDLPPVRERWLVATVVKEIIGQQDFAALKVYYERLMPVDMEGAETFLRLWEREGDTREIDAWLAERTLQHEDWFQLRIHWRTKLGTVNELLDTLAADVRRHPQDLSLVFRYLQANALAGHPQDVSWLGSIFETWLGKEAAPGIAFETYEVGARLRGELPEVSVKLLERSLGLPFTERDMQLIRERFIMRSQLPPRVKNWEKQLRFWTKQQLAEAYRSTNRSQAAQPLIEELVRLKEDDDILPEDVHHLAGAVQSQSGMRVVEAKILSDEATRRESAQYWTERARYYKGRKEYDVVMETYEQALHEFPLQLQDRESVVARLSLLREFAVFALSRYGGNEGNREAHRARMKEVLRREFAAVPPENLYAFGVARIITDNEFDLDDLKESLLVKEREVLRRLLAARSEWALEERGLIEDIVCRESVAPQAKLAYWKQLEDLATSGAASRSYQLADVLLSCHEPGRAIPLLNGFLKRVRERRGEEDTFWEGQAADNLFTAYLAAGEWRAAEKMLRERGDSTGGQLMSDLSSLAVSAARAGDTDDAVRFWSMKANLDRRRLDGLSELALTKAREPLRGMYERMKKRDPLTFIPDQALRILQ